MERNRKRRSGVGHERAFAGARNQVCIPAVCRHSGPSVGNAAMGGPTPGRDRESAMCQEQKFTTRTRPSSAGSKKASTSWAIISARMGYPWLRRPSRISSNVRPGFMSRTGRSLAAPPGLGSTSNGGRRGRVRGSSGPHRGAIAAAARAVTIKGPAGNSYISFPRPGRAPERT